MYEPAVTVPFAGPRVETQPSRATALVRRPACRAAAAALAVAVLGAGAGARQKRTTDPGDTEYGRAARQAEWDERNSYPGFGSSWTLDEWARRDVWKIRQRTVRLAEAIRRATPDYRAARGHAGKLSRHAHTAARWFQGYRQSRPHLEPKAGPPRDLAAVLGDVDTIECLLDEMRAFSGGSNYQLDVARHTATLDRLERIEALARQVETDLRDR